jgi:transcription antitermination protein NusB
VSGPRRQAREAALQILYFWEVGRAQPLAAVESYFAEHQPDAPETVTAFAARLVFGTIAELTEIDATIEQHSRRWRIDRIAVVDRMILRLSIWELRHELDTAAAVIINEALELTRRFSSEEAVRFINGVLDGARQSMNRPVDSRPATPESSTD